MVVRNTLLKRARVSKNLGFQTTLLPFKRLTPKQFEVFLLHFPILPKNRITQLIQSLPDPQLQTEIAKTFHTKYNNTLSTALQLFPTGTTVKSTGCRGMTQNVCRYLQRRRTRPIAEVERLYDTNRRLSVLYGVLPPRKTGKKRETDWNKHLLMTLERRLDVILVRAGFFSTVYQARQCAFHGHVTINDKKQPHGSVLCEPGDVIQVDKKLRPNIAQFWLKEERHHYLAMGSPVKLVPRGLHLEVDPRTLTVIYLYPPQRVLLPAMIDFEALNYKK